MTELSAATLESLGSRVAVPSYDRSTVTTGIVHFGVGGFHRSHQALFTDDVLHSDEGSPWGICGVGMLPADKLMRDVMEAQDRLYAVLICAPDSHEVRVVGAHTEYLFAPDAPSAVVLRLAEETVRIVTLTVTEKGYALDLGTGELDTSSAVVQHDVQALKADETVPFKTAAAYIVAACKTRRQRGARGFAALSCDNVQANGDMLRASVLGMAAEVDASLRHWIEVNVTFPNSMVDRITPATTPEVGGTLRKEFGIEDRWPIICEDFIQWVVEDKFPLGRPAWDMAQGGDRCLFVEDVMPYELMKLRLLNGSHQALAYPARLMGHELVHEAMGDRTVRRFTAAYMDACTASVPMVPGIDLAEYKNMLLERYSNVAVKDQVLRLTEDAANRIKVAVLPCVAAVSSKASHLSLIALVVACWIRYVARQIDDHDGTFTVSTDAVTEPLQPLAIEALQGDKPDATASFLSESLDGDLAPGFVVRVQELVRELSQPGATCRGVVENVLDRCAASL